MAKARPIKGDNAVGLAELLEERAGEPVLEGRSVAVKQDEDWPGSPAINMVQVDAVYLDDFAAGRIGSLCASCFASVEKRGCCKRDRTHSQSNLRFR